MDRTIAIVDYGAGNLRSIQKAVEVAAGNLLDPSESVCTVEVVVTAQPDLISKADAVVLPGVGAAGATMRHLQNSGLVEPLREAASGPRPFLGVCLGLQLLFEHHEEDGTPGLGILPGTARLLPGPLKVPHMGWNRVEGRTEAWETMLGHSPLTRTGVSPYFYFVHSFYVDPAGEAEEAIVGTTPYGVQFCSALLYQNIWGTQFHPEKSGQPGLELLKNFVAQVMV